MVKEYFITANQTFCATVGFSDVTSANVVGYQNLTAPVSGYTWMTPTFEKVDGSVIKLKDITTSTPMGVGDFFITLLDDKGATMVDPETKKTLKFKLVNPGKYSTTTYHCGWYYYDAATADMKNATFKEEMFADEFELPYGTGIGINRTTKSITLVFSGAVAGQDKEITAPKSGYTWTGNVMPTDITLKDLNTKVPMGVGDFFITLLDDKGATKVDPETKKTLKFKLVNPGKYSKETYHCGWYYYDAATADMKNATFKAEMFANDYPIPAGTAFGINRTTKKVTLVIPSPLVDHTVAE